MSTPARAVSEPRLPPISRAELDPIGRELYDDIATSRGGMPTSFKVFLNNPGAAAAISTFGKYVRWETRLPVRVIELTITRVAAQTQDRFMWAHHASQARAAGISARELEAIRQRVHLTSDALTEALVAFIDAEIADSMTDEIFDAVRVKLGPALTMDLALLTAYYAMQHSLFATLRLDSDVDTRVPLDKERDANREVSG